ncbi:hypothetical protein [Adhaeribacter pallidiroseus]|uniref:Uncharacterized protein n=1 Tax=Adhaeribacter pallidiroseus TaxID=2072847 RepID=A0A369QE43_9BACT|nr:hypothetical protein [Adhaeribacter pallidiroseus]RDC62692.1 hypothetical protein AHMF7616_01286 [Adhaeribacter pallidiroseus]
MNNKPIGPTAHGLIDYGFVTLQTLAPSLFNFKGSAKTLCYAFAGTQGILNIFTNHPVAVKRLVPFKVHGQIETPFLPALIALPLLTGALKQRYAQAYFFTFFGVALANYLLTDYQYYEKRKIAGNIPE